jgi:hypothetical protein
MSKRINICTVRGTGGSTTRSECIKIDDDYSELVFGFIHNTDDFYVCVLRAKLYTFVEEKVIYIMDLCGFGYNLWDAVKLFNLDDLDDIEENDIEAFYKSIKYFYPDYEIRKYDPDSFKIFELTKQIFYKIVNYPIELTKFLNNDVIEKINDYNKPVLRTFTNYNIEKLERLWEECDKTCSDQGILCIWFGYDKEFDIFNYKNRQKLIYKSIYI